MLLIRAVACAWSSAATAPREVQVTACGCAGCAHLVLIHQSRALDGQAPFQHRQPTKQAGSNLHGPNVLGMDGISAGRRRAAERACAFAAPADSHRPAAPQSATGHITGEWMVAGARVWLAAGNCLSAAARLMVHVRAWAWGARLAAAARSGRVTLIPTPVQC